MNLIMFIILVLTGALFCFFGYQWKRVIITLIGAYLGYSLVMTLLTGYITNVSLLYTISIAVGLMIGLFSISLYKGGIFLMTSLVIGWIVYSYIPYEVWNIVLAIMIGIFTGILALKFNDFAIIVTTSVTGGFQIVDSVIKYFSLDTSMTIIFGITLSVIGIIFQFIRYKKN